MEATWRLKKGFSDQVDNMLRHYDKECLEITLTFTILLDFYYAIFL